jgi:hypothetical protein
MRGGWGVPAASAVAAVVGPFLGLSVALAVTPSGEYGSVLIGGSGAGLDLRFIAFLFGAPLAALVAAVVAYAFGLQERIWWAGSLGASSGSAWPPRWERDPRGSPRAG